MTLAELRADPERVYWDWFHGVAEAYWRHNERRRAAVATPEQWRQRRNYLKAIFLDALGGLPAKRTPLHVRQLRTLECGPYRIERLVLESLPGLLVTANLYVPADLSGQAPGVLVACGHAENGKAYVEYRRLCTALALKGYVVLIYDPIGQGERRLYRAGSDSLLGGCTSQHTHLAVQLAAVGRGLGRYMVWDSMRCLDYLLARPEVDARRIGMTGCSGGGTNTAYVSALDERVQVSVPVCFINALEHWQHRESIADYEQNLYGQIERGLDHHEYLALVAPRALCIGAATEDFFPLSGTRESYAAARRIYELLGVPERCELTVCEGEHGYSRPLRQAAYRWFNRWLSVEADDEEPEVELPDEEDVCCLPAGVSAAGTHWAVLADAQPLATALAAHHASGEELRRELRRLVGHVPELVSVSAWEEGPGDWELAAVEASGAPPLLAARRRGRPVKEVLVCAGEEALTAGAADKYSGAVLLPMSVEPDLLRRAQQCAQAGPPLPWLLSREASLAFYCLMLGRDWVYLRAAQVLAGLQALGAPAVSLTAHGLLALPALYAAALDERVRALRLGAALWSYGQVLQRERHVLGPPEVPWAVSGSHDLPAVMALLAPRTLVVDSPVGPDGQPLAETELEGLAELRAVYTRAGAPTSLQICTRVSQPLVQEGPAKP
jgi:dienelactone hydrolase